MILANENIVSLSGTAADIVADVICVLAMLSTNVDNGNYKDYLIDPFVQTLTESIENGEFQKMVEDMRLNEGDAPTSKIFS